LDFSAFNSWLFLGAEKAPGKSLQGWEEHDISAA
jgi:hypothetical protein